ncbi:MAG TPA: cupredoxin family copper-binding protein [Burkholderiales bacterium]|nr:cupredoxin family copper-binding protein [Burkholderiales bacterium]
MRIEGMKFVPDRLEVAAGERITWVNRDFVPHTVTGKGVESGELGEGKTFTYVAKAAGELAYICRLHPVMKATIVVR